MAPKPMIIPPKQVIPAHKPPIATIPPTKPFVPVPAKQPMHVPPKQPVHVPPKQPFHVPTKQPVHIPQKQPVHVPTKQPVIPVPAKQPIAQPVVPVPAKQPVAQPVVPVPAKQPVAQPVVPTPSQQPVAQPIADVQRPLVSQMIQAPGVPLRARPQAYEEEQETEFQEEYGQEEQYCECDDQAQEEGYEEQLRARPLVAPMRPPVVARPPVPLFQNQLLCFLQKEDLFQEDQ